MNDAFILHAGRRVPVVLPPPLRLTTMARVPEDGPAPDAQGLCRRAVRAPIGSAPLNERLRPGDTVAVLVEDLTRPAPKAELLRVLLEEISAAGVSDRDVVVVVALGTHRPMTAGEMRDAYGADLTARWRFVNHDCRAPDLVDAARLSSGETVRIHPRVHAADFTVGVGSIVPHPLNGFGGGVKILFPGVADFASILAHHLRLFFDPGTGLGRLAGNQFHGEGVAVARKAGLDWIVNGVMDGRDRLNRVVAGEPLAAHREGVATCRHLLAQPFDGRADVTVTSAAPYREGTQIIKAVGPAGRVTRRGGTIILAAECRGGIPESFVACFERFREKHGQNLRAGIRARFGCGRLIMAEGAVDFNMALAYTLAAMERFRLVLVCPDVSPRDAERMGFVPAADISQALREAARLSESPCVHVIPSGGILLPEVAG